MRNYLLLSLLLAGTISVPTWAQPKKTTASTKSQTLETYKAAASPLTKAADRYFDNQEFALAADYYRQALEKKPDDLYARYQLAESYRHLFDYTRAEESYREVVTTDAKAFPLASFWYGSVLKINNKYAEARQQFQSFLSTFKPSKDKNAPENQYPAQAQTEIRGCELAERELGRPKPNYNFGLLPQPVNSQYNDYAPAAWKGDSVLVITSARLEAKGSAKDPNLGEMFSDIFVFGQNNGLWQDRTSAANFRSLNTSGNDGAGTFNRERTKYYFTSCNTAVNCMIYVSELRDGKWSRPVALNSAVNAAGYTSKQPAVSNSGDTLYFVSDRPGGKGMNDIWYSIRSGGENWGAATNLAALNTPFMDMSPAVLPSEAGLIFASNGREGFGGLDLYIANGKGFTNVTNAGLPFNSSKDDVSMVVDAGGSGYLTSNREGGLGGDDIYSFNLKNLNNPSATSAILDKENADRSVVINTPKVEPVQPTETTVTETTETETTPKPAPARKKTKKELEAERLAAAKAARDAKAAAAREARLAKLAAEREAREARAARAAETAADRAAREAEARAARAARAAEARANAAEATPKTKPSRTRPASGRTEGADRVLARQLFESIYFNFDQDGLRPEAEKVMADLAGYLNDNPEATIEVHGYTDNVGDPAYNKELANRRAATATNYLTGKGIASDRINVEAEGEANPLATNSGRIGRRLNRRVEFIVRNGKVYTEGGMVYIAQENTTATAIAKKFGMTKEELMEMNGLTEDVVSSYEPIRVRRTGKAFIAPSTMAVGHASKSGTSLNR